LETTFYAETRRVREYRFWERDFPSAMIVDLPVKFFPERGVGFSLSRRLNDPG
jgi:hypothetical protein